MWWLLVNLLFYGFIVAQPHNSQPYCFTDDTDPYHQFATKTPYNYSRGHFSSLELVPEGELLCNERQFAITISAASDVYELISASINDSHWVVAGQDVWQFRHGI